MSDELMVLTREIINENPEFIGERLARMAKRLQSSKSDSHDTRGKVIKRMINATSLDILDRPQINSSVGNYLTSIFSIIILAGDNPDTLKSILGAMTSVERINRMQTNKYLQTAKDYFSKALETSQRKLESDLYIQELKRKQQVLNTGLQQQENTADTVMNKLLQYDTAIAQHESYLKIHTNSTETLNKENKDLLSSMQKDILHHNEQTIKQSEQLNELQKLQKEQAEHIQEYDRQLEHFAQILDTEEEEGLASGIYSRMEEFTQGLTAKISALERAMDVQEKKNKQLEDELEFTKAMNEKHGNIASAALWFSGIVLIVTIIRIIL